MKKTYINPTMVVVKVKTQQLLAGSVGDVVLDSTTEFESGDVVGAPAMDSGIPLDF
jgi:hypothetical protein